MGILATAKATDFQPHPEGIHLASCIGVFDLGLQRTNFGNKSQVCLLFETEVTRDNGERMTISIKFAPSLHEKATFRKMLESWSGKKVTPQMEKEGFDCMKLLGKPCQLQVIHHDSAGKIYANIQSILPLGKGQTSLTPSKELMSFSFADHGKNIPANVPQWVADKIKQSINWQGGIEPHDEPEFAADDAVNGGQIPF